MQDAIDHAAVNELRTLGQSVGPAFLQRVAAQFEATCAASAAGLAAALEGADEAAFRHHVHTLKGSSRMVGARQVGDLAEALEQAPWPPPSAELDALREATVRAKRALDLALFGNAP